MLLLAEVVLYTTKITDHNYLQVLHNDCNTSFLNLSWCQYIHMYIHVHVHMYTCQVNLPVELYCGFHRVAVRSEVGGS